LLLLEITLILAMTFIFLHTSKFISVIFSTNSQQLASIVGQSGELVKWVPWVQSGASRSSPEVTMGDRRLRWKQFWYNESVDKLWRVRMCCWSLCNKQSRPRWWTGLGVPLSCALWTKF